MEDFMPRKFTNYPQTSEIPFEKDKVSKLKRDKKIRKLHKKIKKQKRLIRKLNKCREAGEGCTSSGRSKNDSKKSTQNKEKSFFSKVKDRLIDALPSICRTMVKTATTIICGWALKRFGKSMMA